MGKIIKLYPVFLALVLTMTAFSAPCEAADYTDASYVSVVADGKVLTFEDQAPVISQGRTLLPLRKIFDALGASVYWDDQTKTVFASKGDITIAVQIDEHTMFKNEGGQSFQYTLDIAPMLVSDRTMIPARAVSEAFGAEVTWDEQTKTVTIVSKK